MIEFEKMRASTAKNPHYFDTYWIIELLFILYNIYIIFRNQNEFKFYVNNYINQNQFDQLYNADQIQKDIRNAEVVAYKLKLALTKAINHRLELTRESKQKKEENNKKRKNQNYNHKMQKR